MSEDILRGKLKDIAKEMGTSGIDFLSTTFVVGKDRYFMKYNKAINPTVKTRGICSRIPKTMEHILPLDYDGVKKYVPKEDAVVIQDWKRCGNFYLFQSRKYAFHTYCIDHFTVPDVNECQLMSNCDRAYHNGPLWNYTRGWVLRYKSKGNQPAPKFIGVIKSPYEGERLQSSFHANFLNKVYKLNIKLKNPDGLNDGYTQPYTTRVKEEG